VGDLTLLQSFGLREGLCGFANVPNAGWQRNFKKCEAGLFLSFLSPAQIAKHGQIESLPAWSIWSVCRVHF
jgi:hypothetical protein